MVRELKVGANKMPEKNPALMTFMAFPMAF